MDFEIYAAFLIFASLASITPGPNNLLAMTSGSLFGWRATVPLLLGIEIGFLSLLISAIFGLDLFLAKFPWFALGIRIVGIVWLILFGLKFILAASNRDKMTSTEKVPATTRPVKFYEAFLFQWVNPKGLVMATSCASSFALIAPTASTRAFIMGTSYAIIGTIACSAWVLFGSTLANFLNSGRYAHRAQFVMGALLILTAASLLFV